MICTPEKRRSGGDPSNGVLLMTVVSFAWLISFVTMNDTFNIIGMKIKTAPGFQRHG
jgi:hypothetical protein